jgi:hypothetical protein
MLPIAATHPALMQSQSAALVRMRAEIAPTHAAGSHFAGSVNARARR